MTKPWLPLIVFVLLGISAAAAVPPAAAQEAYVPPAVGAYARAVAAYPYGYPGYPYGSRRLYRQAVRYAIERERSGLPPAVTPAPGVPGYPNGYPNYGSARRPSAYDKNRTGPKDYLNRSGDDHSPSPTPARRAVELPPQPASPVASPDGLVEPPVPESATPSEAIPMPPSEPGPKEF
jgi:hypothetical protein